MEKSVELLYCISFLASSAIHGNTCDVFEKY